MLPFKLIYHPGYDLNLGPHVFPSQKFRLIHDKLLADGTAEASDFRAPGPASDEDISRVHTQDYLYKLKSGALTRAEILRMEVPYSLELVDAFWLAAGGSILAGQSAMKDRAASNIGGGFHHAYPDHGEGFCVIHDVAVAIRRLQADREARRAMVVDTDNHHGNGTAAIFADDDSVFTFSIHQQNNYPSYKPPSDIDVDLPDFIGDDDYLEFLDKNLHQAFDRFDPEILFYVAGADPYRDDQLGGLALTIEGLKKRDALVCEYAKRKSLPVVTTLAGGYARRLEDTVQIHVNTILALRASI